MNISTTIGIILHMTKPDHRPMVMLVGQYSTGKTTFIRYLLEQVMYCTGAGGWYKCNVFIN